MTSLKYWHFCNFRLPKNTLAEHRAHLDLQINLLTGQKATKILQLVDELRRELPALRGQLDAEVDEPTKPADAQAILNEIKRLDDER